MDRREDLERWIAGTRRTQRQLKLGLVIASVVAVGLFFVSKAAGGIAVAIVALVALSGFWITSGHLTDWQAKLYKLDHPEQAASGRRGRYQRD